MKRAWIRAWVVCVAVVPALAVAQPRRQMLILGDEEWIQAAKEHLDHANRLAERRKFKEAVEELVWLLDNRPASYPEIENCLTRETVAFIYSISTPYPRAAKTLKKRRARIEKLFRAGKGDYAQGLELDAINQKLGDWSRTQDLYEELAEQGEKGRRTQRELFMYVEEALLDEEAYEELLKGGGRGPGSLDNRVKRLKLRAETIKAFRVDDLERAKLALCRSAARHYQAMLATGRKEAAARLADRFLTYHETGKVYVLFIRHAVKAKKNGTARRLVRRAEDVLSKVQYAEVKEEAKYIPKKKKKKRNKKRG